MTTAHNILIEPDNDSNRILRAEAEGELFSEGRLEISAIPNGLKVIVPQNWSFENQSVKVKK